MNGVATFQLRSSSRGGVIRSRGGKSRGSKRDASRAALLQLLEWEKGMEQERVNLISSYYWKKLLPQTRDRLKIVFDTEREHTDRAVRALLQDYKPSLKGRSQDKAQQLLRHARARTPQNPLPPRASTALGRMHPRVLASSAIPRPSQALTPSTETIPTGELFGTDEGGASSLIPTTLTSLPPVARAPAASEFLPRSPLTGLRPSSREFGSNGGRLPSRGHLASAYAGLVGPLDTLREEEPPIAFRNENHRKVENSRTKRRPKRRTKRKSARQHVSSSTETSL